MALLSTRQGIYSYFADTGRNKPAGHFNDGMGASQQSRTSVQANELPVRFIENMAKANHGGIASCPQTHAKTRQGD